MFLLIEHSRTTFQKWKSLRWLKFIVILWHESFFLKKKATKIKVNLSCSFNLVANPRQINPSWLMAGKMSVKKIRFQFHFLSYFVRKLFSSNNRNGEWKSRGLFENNVQKHSLHFRELLTHLSNFRTPYWPCHRALGTFQTVKMRWIKFFVFAGMKIDFDEILNEWIFYNDHRQLFLPPQ